MFSNLMRKKIQSNQVDKWINKTSQHSYENDGVRSTVFCCITTWKPSVWAHQRKSVTGTLSVGYLLLYIIVKGKSGRWKVPGLPPCCFKWFKMDFLPFSPLLAKTGTLWAIKAIKKVFQSNPCRQAPAQKKQNESFFSLLFVWLPHVSENCSGHLTPCNRWRCLLLFVSVGAGCQCFSRSDIDEVVPRLLLSTVSSCAVGL